MTVRATHIEFTPRPVVYISGPISNGGKADEIDRLANVSASLRPHSWLVRAGFAVINPLLTEAVDTYIRRGDYEPLGHGAWLEGDLSILHSGAVDAVLRLAGESKGADMEVAYAKHLGIPAFTTKDGLEAAIYGLTCLLLGEDE